MWTTSIGNGIFTHFHIKERALLYDIGSYADLPRLLIMVKHLKAKQKNEAYSSLKPTNHPVIIQSEQKGGGL
ncbi:hypothetical protein JCM16418A_31310 [Paenibacillus pini]